MSYSPMSFTTATSGRAGFVRLGSGIGGQSDGTIVSNATLLGLTASSVGLGNVTNESKATMFSNPTFTGTVGGVTASHVGLGNVTNESKGTMFAGPTFTSSGASRITFNGTATIANGNAFTFGPNAYSALVETGNNDIVLVHGARHVKGTLNDWIGVTPAFHATAFVMGVEQQVASKKFVWKSAPDQTNSPVTWTDVLWIDTSNNLYSIAGIKGDSLGVGTAPSGTTGEIRATGNITGYYSSDIKFKENIQTITGAVDIVSAIGGKTFDWKEDYIQTRGGEDGYFIQKNDFGVIAQDVQRVFPMATRTREDGSLAVDYHKLSALAFAAIIELKAEIDVLKNLLSKG